MAGKEAYPSLAGSRIAPLAFLWSSLAPALALAFLTFGAVLGLLRTPQAFAQPVAQPGWQQEGGEEPAAEKGERPRLLRSQVDIYLVTGRIRRWVVNPQVFADYRFSEAWVETISDERMQGIPRGPDLIAGPLFHAPDGELWVVYQGTRRRLAGPDALAPLNLTPDETVPVTDAQLRSYPEGRPVGNPSRPWMLPLLLALGLAAGVASGWRARWPLVTERLALAAIFITAALLKVYYVTLYPWTPDGPDAVAYVATARSVLANGLLGRDPTGGLIAVTAPLYPIILAATSVATRVAGGSVVGWKLVQVALAVALIPVVWDLARRLYGPSAARAAALITTLSPLWFYTAELLQYELWLGFLILVAVWGAVRAGDLGPRWRWWAAGAGLAYGLATFMQLKVSSIVLPALLYLTWRVLGAAPLTAVPGGARRLNTGILVLFGLLAVAPVAGWGARNLALHGEFLLGSTGGGGLIWMGNHPNATGGYMQLPRPDAFYERQRRYPEQSITRDARAYSDLGWEYIQTHPTHFLLLALTKLERFWWTITPERLGEWAELRTVAFLGGGVDATAVRAFSKLLQELAVLTILVGALWSRPTGGPSRAAGGRALLLATVLIFWVVHVPFIAEPRYRIPVAPLLHVVQGAGLVALAAGLARLPHAARRWFDALSPGSV